MINLDSHVDSADVALTRLGNVPCLRKAPIKLAKGYVKLPRHKKGKWVIHETGKNLAA